MAKNGRKKFNSKIKEKEVIVIDDQVGGSEEGRECSHLQKKGDDKPSNPRKRQKLSRNKDSNQHNSGPTTENNGDASSRGSKKRRATSVTPTPEAKFVPKFGRRKQKDNKTQGNDIDGQETSQKGSETVQKISLNDNGSDPGYPAEINSPSDVHEMETNDEKNGKDTVCDSVSTEEQTTEGCIAEDGSDVCKIINGENENTEMRKTDNDDKQSIAPEMKEKADEIESSLDGHNLQAKLNEDGDPSGVVPLNDSCGQQNKIGQETGKNLSMTAEEGVSAEKEVEEKEEEVDVTDAQHQASDDGSPREDDIPPTKQPYHAEEASSFKCAQDSRMLHGLVPNSYHDTCTKDQSWQHGNLGSASHSPTIGNFDQCEANLEDCAENHTESRVNVETSSELLPSVRETRVDTTVRKEGEPQMAGTSTEDVNRLQQNNSQVSEQSETNHVQNIINESDERKIRESNGLVEPSTDSTVVDGIPQFDILDCTQPFEIVCQEFLPTYETAANATAKDLSIIGGYSNKETHEEVAVDVNEDSADITKNEDATNLYNCSYSKDEGKSVAKDGQGISVLTMLRPLQDKAFTEEGSVRSGRLAVSCGRANDGEIEVEKPTFEGEPPSAGIKDSATVPAEIPQFCLSACGDGDQLVGELMDFTDSQMMELEEQCNMETQHKRSSADSHVAGGNGQRFEEKAIQTVNTCMAQEDQTKLVQSMIKELQELNSTILDIKKQIEGFRRQRRESTLPVGASNQQQRNDYNRSPWKRLYHR